MSVNRSRLAANLVADNNITSDIDNNRVGIGSTIPTATLNVAGIVSATSYYGDGSNLTGISGGSGSLAIGFAATTGETSYVVGTGVTLVNFVGAGYTVEIAGGIATVRNLKMDLKQIVFTSAGYATTINEGSQVSYTASVNDSNAVFALEDNGGITGLGINYTTGALGGGSQASPGTYTVKIRAASPFGMSDSFPVTVGINTFSLTMDTMFGDAESLLTFDDDVTDAQYVALEGGGVVANDGVNYVIDRDNSVQHDATNHALYYDNTNNALIGFRYSSAGALNGIGRWTSVSDATDGTDVGSGSMWSTDSGVLLPIGSTFNSLRGPNLGIGTQAGIGSATSGYQPTGQYNGGWIGGAFYMRIIPSDSTLDNFGTRIDSHDWSYGFTLEDPWLMGAPSQILAPESVDDGWHTIAYRRYRIGTSYFNSNNYGNNTFQGNSSSGFQAGWSQETDDANNLIAPPGSTVAVYYDRSVNDYLLFINGTHVHTGTSQYLYMKSSGSTSQPVLSFGDSTNSLDGIPNDDDQIAGWPYRIRDLWIANNAGITTTDVVSISTFRDRNLADYSGYSNIDTYITLTGAGTSIEKGNVSIARSAVTYS